MSDFRFVSRGNVQHVLGRGWRWRCEFCGEGGSGGDDALDAHWATHGQLPYLTPQDYANALCGAAFLQGMLVEALERLWGSAERLADEHRCCDFGVDEALCAAETLLTLARRP